MLQRLFGRLVLVVVVVLGLWFVISHYHGNDEFGCQIDFSAAHADDNDCPTTLDQAAGDARWAADRIATTEVVKVNETSGSDVRRCWLRCSVR